MHNRWTPQEQLPDIYELCCIGSVDINKYTREPHIDVVTRGGVVKGEYQEELYGQPQVHLTTKNKSAFYVQREKGSILRHVTRIC